jgi:hypothetical protein
VSPSAASRPAGVEETDAVIGVVWQEKQMGDAAQRRA